MSKIARKTAAVFGASAGTNQIAQFGSLAAGTPTFTTDPAVIQQLSNYLVGWFSGVIGANSPAIEDMNAICYLFAYQIAYMMQAGIPEWDSGTTYYKGSLVTSVAGGLIYVSLQDTNTNNALTNTTYWRPMSQPGYDAVVGADPYCTHASLTALLADANYNARTNLRVLITSSLTINSTLAITKTGWQFEALPGVTLTAGSATICFQPQAPMIEFRKIRFVGFATAIQAVAAAGPVTWDYGRVTFCNFNTCTTDVDTTACVAGKIAVTLGNIDE